MLIEELSYGVRMPVELPVVLNIVVVRQLIG